MNPLIKSCWIALALLAATATFAQEGESDEGQFLSFTLENDAPNGTDRYYSSGIEVTWSKWQRLLPALPFELSFPAPPPPAIRDLPNFHAGQSYSLRSIAVGQQIYTPADLSNPDYLPSDRPYAGWSYLQLSLARAWGHRRQSVAIEVGTFGPNSQADEAQSSFHKLIGSAVPQGWEHQVKNHVSADLILTRDDRLLSQRILGDYRLNLSSSQKLRLGSANSKLELGFATDFAKGTPGSDRRSIRYFSRGSISLVGRDRSLSNPYRESSTGVAKASLVPRLEAGFEYQLPKAKLSFSIVRLGKQFASQEGDHSFVSISYSLW
ncbi:lipid A deacylase LpxR family protein [Pelagicoccus enzymogenes]|uniref:lipid A deacylase LpxR family protein n=1 Tax=Pelagicoccus enzymogenes TaxID=2773457 RepID=UPI00280CA673|nr:lipid A deacylase LpxR family protein [Pelagicoccus enzymogenes]MDQ8201196.1 lipid A deacylase LpxR family protein [Pelagicoccus enzymogenes]